MHWDVPSGEVGIVWLDSPDMFEYVRASVVDLPRRQECPAKWRVPGYRMVGYSVLDKDAPSEDGLPGMFLRRVFWLAEHDRPYEPLGCYRTGCPAEAVDPFTVRPGVWGEQNERAWGQPTEHG